MAKGVRRSVGRSRAPARGRRAVRVSAEKLKVGINGFGRIGRNFLRCVEGREDTNLEIVALNDSRGPKNAAHLLKYDSILGTFDADVAVTGDDSISVNGKPIKVLGSRCAGGRPLPHFARRAGVSRPA